MTITFTIEAIRIEDYDDEVHISGPGFSAPNTLCGITDAGSTESTDEKPTCTTCIEVYESVKQHRPRFKFV